MRGYAVALLLLVPVSAQAQAPESTVKLITQDQAKDCKSLGIVSHSKMAMWSIDKATQALLQEALRKAEKEGANAAIMMPLANNRNLYTVMLQTYQCPN